jgi:hypothetical protein
MPFCLRTAHGIEKRNGPPAVVDPIAVTRRVAVVPQSRCDLGQFIEFSCAAGKESITRHAPSAEPLEPLADGDLLTCCSCPREELVIDI